MKSEETKKKEELERRADMAVAELGETPDDDFYPATRFSEEPTVQLLLLRKGNLGEKLSRRIYPFFSKDPVDLPERSASRTQHLEAAKKLLPLMLKVPERNAPDWQVFPADFLDTVLWTGDGSNRPIRAAYVDESGHLLDQSCNFIEKNHSRFEYHENLGYIRKKSEEK